MTQKPPTTKSEIITIVLGILGTIVVAALTSAVVAKVTKEKTPLEPNKLTNLPPDWNKYH